MELEKRLQKITTLFFDVDGVMTDGSLILLPDGTQARTMNVKDGYALKYALHNGLEVVIISAGKSKEVEQRLRLLGVKHIHMEVHNKLKCMQDFMANHRIAVEETLFMGDDIPDHDCILHASIGCSPADAVAEIQEIVDYTSNLNGGKGCVRDVITQVLKSQGKWQIDTHVMSR